MARHQAAALAQCWLAAWHQIVAWLGGGGVSYLPSAALAASAALSGVSGSASGFAVRWRGVKPAISAASALYSGRSAVSYLGPSAAEKAGIELALCDRPCLVGVLKLPPLSHLNQRMAAAGIVAANGGVSVAAWRRAWRRVGIGSAAPSRAKRHIISQASTRRRRHHPQARAFCICSLKAWRKEKASAKRKR